MPLRFLPLLGSDDTNNIELIYDWLQDLVDDFANAVGEAIDPTEGQGGDGALSIDQVPSDVAYVPNSALSVDNVLVGYIDITFTLPARAIDLAVQYRQQGAGNFSTLFCTDSPHRLSNLSIGVTYEIQAAGRSANGNFGPFSDLETLTIPVTGLETTVPTDLTATGTFQTIVLTWTASEGGGLRRYEVQRALDSDFTLELQTWTVDTTRFVDDTGVTGVSYFYRVRSMDSSGAFSAYTDTISATTQPLSGVDAPGMDHLHGLYRAVADGVLTIYPLPDMAEYVELVTVGGLEADPLVYSVSRSAITFAVAPIAAAVIAAHYVVERV